MRLFLAVELSEAVRQSLAALQTELRKRCPGWRWVRAESLHLTLRFLGEVDEERDAACRRLWREAVGRFGPFELGLSELGRFPPAGRPRVLWIGARAEPERTLGELAAALEDAARSAGFPAETRPFRPHLTLARAERRPRVPDPAPAGDVPVQSVEEIVLFRSRLGPGGARYTALDRFALQE